MKFLEEWGLLWLLVGFIGTLGNIFIMQKWKAGRVGLLVYIMAVLLGPLTLLMFLINIITSGENKVKTCRRCGLAINKAEAQHCPHCGEKFPSTSYREY